MITVGVQTEEVGGIRAVRENETCFSNARRYDSPSSEFLIRAESEDEWTPPTSEYGSRDSPGIDGPRRPVSLCSSPMRGRRSNWE